MKPKYWFQLWRTEIKVHDWNCIEAELIKIAGYTGKAYVVRHELHLVVCRPGTNEVVDRISLKGLEPLDAILAEMWTGVRRFMEGGPDAVPGIETKVREIGFLYSLFAYMPYLSPSEAGIRFRNSMRWYDWGLACITIWFSGSGSHWASAITSLSPARPNHNGLSGSMQKADHFNRPEIDALPKTTRRHQIGE